MPHFNYTAIDHNGMTQVGQLEAGEVKLVARLLRAQGLFPTKVTLVEVAVARHSGFAVTPRKAPLPPTWWQELPILGRAPVPPKTLAIFTRQLASLLRAGLPLLRSLEVLARQERHGYFHRTLTALVVTLQSGGAFSEALAQHPQIFDRLYLNMIKAGEAGATLAVLLDRLAQFREKSLRLKGQLSAALMYPLLVLTVAGLILGGLLIFVVPKFQQIFAELLKGAPLPALTQLILTISQLFKVHYFLGLGLGCAVSLAGFLYWRTPHGARQLARGMIKLPLFGELLLESIVARFARTLATLLSSGVPILSALLITRDTVGNVWVSAAITTVHDRVKEGATVAQPLVATGIFPPMVTSMIEVGEETGRLPEMLEQIGAIYEAEVDHTVAGLSSLLEPFLILFLALIVGTIVVALFLPIVRIVQLLT